jgi:hypothetical protein
LTKWDGLGVSSASAFIRAFVFQSNATGGQETTPTIAPKPQHRPKVRAIATLREDGSEISHCGYRIILKPSRFQKKPYGGPAEEIRRGF